MKFIAKYGDCLVAVVEGEHPGKQLNRFLDEGGEGGVFWFLDGAVSVSVTVAVVKEQVADAKNWTDGTFRADSSCLLALAAGAKASDAIALFEKRWATRAQGEVWRVPGDAVKVSLRIPSDLVKDEKNWSA